MSERSIVPPMQGDKVRLLKTQKADKGLVDAEVKTLLALKERLAKATGKTTATAQSSKKKKPGK